MSDTTCPRGRGDCPRGRRDFGAIVLFLVLLASPVRAEPSVTLLPLGFEVEEFRGPGSHVAKVFPTLDIVRRDRPATAGGTVVVWGKGGGAAFSLVKGELNTLLFAPPDREAPSFGEEGRDAVPGSRQQSAGPISVHLAGPTDAYPHGAVGRATARELVISERQPVAQGAGVQKVPVRVTRVSAGPDAVFEDLEPRLADLDRDGTPEILVVKSTPDKGSALAVIGRLDGEWKIVAETPPTGEPNGWLNPAAVADFDGDGTVDIALVRTPHRDGVLQVWAWEGGRLALKHEAGGYSNHAFGKTALDLAAAVDLDGDGVPELAIPTVDRASLAILSLKGGIKERQRISLPAKAERGVAALGSGKEARLIVGLEDGRIAVVRP